ncbi:MAG: LCP family protein [Patescibacteria group bacterium]|nr:LCP family protein [Patescibacteria group bacterium]
MNQPEEVLTTNQPENNQEDKKKFSANFLRLALLIFVLPPLFFLLAIAIGSFFYLESFSSKTGLGVNQVINQSWQGFKNPYQEKYLTFLLLGLDQRPEDETMLTDTILVVGLNTQTGSYLLFSIPRDLWISPLKTKINALYYYGIKENPSDPTKIVRQEVEKIIDRKINHTIVLKMESIKDLVDLLGEIEINIERGFVDSEFPKDDGSNQVMTIEFNQGKQVFSGERALQFIRSRKSQDQQEGGDDARQKRQKQIITALKEKLVKDRATLINPEKLAKLYNFFQNDLDLFPKVDLARITSFYRIVPKLIDGEQKQIEIPWKEEGAILTAAKDPLYGTWILIPKNNDWQPVKDFFSLNLP